jgi:hypothetical protein
MQTLLLLLLCVMVLSPLQMSTPTTCASAVATCTHATLYKKGGSAGCTERHDELKNAVARVIREYHVEARVRVEPNIVRHCKLRAVNHAKRGRCRADLLVTDSDRLYIYDFVVLNAAAASVRLLPPVQNRALLQIKASRRRMRSSKRSALGFNLGLTSSSLRVAQNLMAAFTPCLCLFFVSL